MSGERPLWAEGVAVVDEDLQRLADVATGADDLALEALCEGGIGATDVLKRILPLEGTEDIAVAAPQLLVTGAGLGGAVGVAPALLEAFVRDGIQPVPRLAFSARLRAFATSVTLSANPGGTPRTDALYATISRANTAPVSRRYKAPTGGVSTQSIVPSSVPTVTLHVAEGTTAIPADGPGAYNFSLAEITVPAAYGAFTEIQQSWIVQKWGRLFLPSVAARAITGSQFGAGDAAHLTRVSSPEPDWSRFGGERTFYVPFKHISDVATIVPLGDRVAALDWRNRLVRVSLVRAVVHTGEYPAPHAVTAPGASVTEASGWLYTGSANGTVWTSARGFVLSTSGIALRLSKPAGTAADGVSGDNWLLILEASDQFV